MTKIKEDLILRSQKIVFVLKMLKQFLITEYTQVLLSVRRKYILFETAILNVLAETFNDSINNEKCLLQIFQQGKYLTPQPLHIDSNDNP